MNLGPFRVVQISRRRRYLIHMCQPTALPGRMRKRSGRSCSSSLRAEICPVSLASCGGAFVQVTVALVAFLASQRLQMECSHFQLFLHQTIMRAPSHTHLRNNPNNGCGLAGFRSRFSRMFSCYVGARMASRDAVRCSTRGMHTYMRAHPHLCTDGRRHMQTHPHARICATIFILGSFHALRNPARPILETAFALIPAEQRKDLHSEDKSSELRLLWALRFRPWMWDGATLRGVSLCSGCRMPPGLANPISAAGEPEGRNLWRSQAKHAAAICEHTATPGTQCQ